MYRAKLQAMAREINAIVERVRRLKVRAFKLKEAKQRQEMANADALEKQRQREKHLEAKPAQMPGSWAVTIAFSLTILGVANYFIEKKI